MKSKKLLTEIHVDLGGGTLALEQLIKYSQALLEEWEESETNYFMETMPFDTPDEKYYSDKERMEMFINKLK